MLTLDEAVAIGLATQPQIQARLGDYAAARYRVTQALAPLLPQLSAGVTATKTQQTTTESTRTLFINNQRVPRAGSDLTVTSVTTQSFGDSFAAQVSLSQLLFDFGKNLAATEAARRLADVAFEDVELQRQLIVLSIREAYSNLVLARQLARVQQQAGQRAQLTLRAAQRTFEAGLRAEADVARAEVDVANAEIQVIRATNTTLLGRVALATAMGLDARTPLEIQDALTYQPMTFDSEALFSESLLQRPEHRQARLRIDASEALERQAFRNFFPDIVGSGSYGGTQVPALNESWLVGLSMSWSFLDGGNKLARYQEAKANVAAARARLQLSALDLSRDVEQTILSATEAQARIKAAGAAVRAAERNYKFAEGRFRSGLATIIELTDAQFAVTQAHSTEAEALSDYRLALYRLDRAVGRR
jgi:outer membrane protein